MSAPAPGGGVNSWPQASRRAPLPSMNGRNASRLRDSIRSPGGARFICANTGRWIGLKGPSLGWSPARMAPGRLMTEVWNDTLRVP